MKQENNDIVQDLMLRLRLLLINNYIKLRIQTGSFHCLPNTIKLDSLRETLMIDDVMQCCMRRLKAGRVRTTLYISYVKLVSAPTWQ